MTFQSTVTDSSQHQCCSGIYEWQFTDTLSSHSSYLSATYLLSSSLHAPYKSHFQWITPTLWSAHKCLRQGPARRLAHGPLMAGSAKTNVYFTQCPPHCTKSNKQSSRATGLTLHINCFWLTCAIKQVSVSEVLRDRNCHFHCTEGQH